MNIANGMAISFPISKNSYRRQLLERDGAYADISFQDRFASDNGIPIHRKVS